MFPFFKKTREEKIRKRNEAIEEAKRLESQKIEIKEEEKLLEVKMSEDIKIPEVKILPDNIKIEDEEKKKEEELISEQENIPKTENEQIIDENLLKSDPISQEPQIEESIKKNVFEDLEIPDTMEVIQVTEVLSPKLVDEPIIEDIKPLPLPITQEIMPEEIKPKSPSPVSTMTCSIDGNTDTEWNVPVAPAMGTIKINISQKITPVLKPVVPVENSSIEPPRSPPDFTPTFGEIDPDQPPPPGLEMETVVIPKIQREMKPRLMHNVKKLREYPIVNKGKEMSGLCSIM